MSYFGIGVVLLAGGIGWTIAGATSIVGWLTIGQIFFFAGMHIQRAIIEWQAARDAERGIIHGIMLAPQRPKGD